jgi:cytochrome c oxidase assembly protein subunit 15
MSTGGLNLDKILMLLNALRAALRLEPVSRHAALKTCARTDCTRLILSCQKYTLSLQPTTSRLGRVVSRLHPSPRFLHCSRPNFSQLEDGKGPGSLPILPPLSVGRWLMASSALVLGIIVVGGVTRLTESGLSITEWRPITGILPPLSHEEWATEFEKYRATPEFKLYDFLL